MEQGSFESSLKAWREAREKLVVSFTLVRRVLKTLIEELEEREKQLRTVFESVDQFLERLRADFDKQQK